MAKNKSSYTCSECGQETSGWLGRCPGCGNWNTLVEARQTPAEAGKNRRGPWVEHAPVQNSRNSPVIRLSEVDGQSNIRIPSGLRELDRVLGGGFVAGSLVLIGGDPGIGKSTLLLQVLGLVKEDCQTLYISGEESAQQIRLRADRLGIAPGQIQLLAATDYETVAQAIMQKKPALAVVDSIQTLYAEDMSSAPGSVSQVREVTAGLLRIAKNQGTTIVLVGHVTKDGAIAGPRVLEHMVDTVLYFEGEKQQNYRILRAVKNRFGATDELGLFEMSDKGLQPVENASQAFLEGRPLQVAGSIVTACMEGTRPILVEIQALLNPSTYGSPQRMAQGLDRSRIIMLLAVLDKHFHFGLNNMDAYVNVVGGIRLSETAVDLAILSAVISSLKDRPIREGVLAFGEIGLSGEIRAVSQADRRIAEAARLGFQTFILPGSCRKALEKAKLPSVCDLLYVDRISEALDMLFT
jgi:DNA repair protein RadA/Sms